MSPQPVQSVKLFFQEGNSDKVYHATLLDEGGGAFSVEVEWGRRGSKLNRGRKAVKVPRAAAQKTFDQLVREKTSKGYERITEAVQPAPVAPPEGEGSGSRATGVRKRVGLAAQLLNPIDEDRLEELLADTQHLAQQKIDGSRVLVHVQASGFLATNRAGQLTNVQRGVLEGLQHLPVGTIVDGEVVTTAEGTEYWLFDVLAVGGEDVRARPYLERWTRLSEELEPGLSEPVWVVESAREPHLKRTLFDRLRASHAEGIVFKRSDAPYAPGRPASGGAQLKHKFVKSADVVLVENAGNAYRMVVFEGAVRREVGKVFAGTTNELRALLDARLAAGQEPVAEVRYLYATDDDQLFQPVFVRLREDKPAATCALSQLRRTSRQVLR